MCNSTISLSRSVEEIVKDIKDSVSQFFDSDEVKKVYQDYFDTIIAEVKDEYVASNTPIEDESIIEERKDLLVKYHLATGFLTYTKGHAKTFDYFLTNPYKLSSEQIEDSMRTCLKQEHMMKCLKQVLSNSEQRERLKEIFRGLMLKR